MTITSIQFRNFKTHASYSVGLRSFNVLVGPNNSGKSSILDGLRLLFGALRFARTRKPSLLQPTDRESGSHWGWHIPVASFPFSLENIQTNYCDEAATVSV